MTKSYKGPKRSCPLCRSPLEIVAKSQYETLDEPTSGTRSSDSKKTGYACFRSGCSANSLGVVWSSTCSGPIRLENVEYLLKSSAHERGVELAPIEQRRKRVQGQFRNRSSAMALYESVRIDLIQMRHIKGLEDLIETLPENMTMIEIGSFTGESAELFIRSGKVKKIICIDPWSDEVYAPLEASGDTIFKKYSDRMDLVKREMGGLPEIIAIREFSAKASLALKDSSYDFVYIDGDHSYKGVVDDIKNYLPKLKPDGILAGHDYYPNDEYSYEKKMQAFPEVPAGVNDMVGKPDRIFPDTSWAIKVKNISPQQKRNLCA
jgi:hypothetical protein